MTEFRCEPLAKHHHRARFRCGVPALDDWLARVARQDHDRGVSKTFVFVPVDEPRRVAGFYSLSSASIELTDFPSEYARKLPRYAKVPATLLGRLARDQDFPGIGQRLLADALHRAWLHSLEIASIAVIVDAKDEQGVEFYRRHLFQPLIETPRRLFLPLSMVRKSLK